MQVHEIIKMVEEVTAVFAKYNVKAGILVVEQPDNKELVGVPFADNADKLNSLRAAAAAVKYAMQQVDKYDTLTQKN